MSKGIDYSPRGSTVNRDPETGIRYGIIPLHSLNEWALESFESEYDPACPACGTDLAADFDPYSDETKCPACEVDLRGSEQIYGDTPSRQTLDDGETRGMLDESGDVWIFKSPFYTLAAFCSPCAPGACYLTSPCADGEKAYCLGPDWFDEENPAPYPIYSVATGELIKRECE